MKAPIQDSTERLSRTHRKQQAHLERMACDTWVAFHPWEETSPFTHSFTRSGSIVKLKAHTPLEGVGASTLAPSKKQSDLHHGEVSQQLSLVLSQACATPTVLETTQATPYETQAPSPSIYHPVLYPHHAVIGLDEVGRGALMGPVVTAAVSFPHYPLPLEVQEALRVANDSKTLKATQREALYHLILTHAHVGIGWANAEEVDQWNIHRATLLAFYRAVHHLWHQHGTPQQCSLLVDGIHALPAYWFEAQPTSPLLRQWTMVQGDQRSLSIACASIVAKHLRDTWAETLSTTYPLYRPFAWEKNKGYGSTEHREALQQYGATLFHRNTFLKKLEVNPTLFKVPTSLDTDTSAFVLPQGLSVGFGLETQRPVTFP